MNELQKQMLEQLRDKAIEDLKGNISDDEIDDIVSSATDKLLESGSFPTPSSLYAPTMNNSIDDEMSVICNNASALAEKYFDKSLTDNQIFISILESGELDQHDQRLAQFVEVAIIQHRKFLKFKEGLI